MKSKSILLIFIMPLLFILLASCEKESVISNNDDLNQSVNNQLKTQPQLRVFYDGSDPEEPIGCRDLGGNCLLDVDVKPQAHINAFNDVFDAINEGDDEDVINVFEEHEDVLLNYISQDCVSNTISGDYTTEGYEDSQIRYLEFVDGGDQISVYPILK